MTNTTISKGVALAAKLKIKAVQTELHQKKVELFNLNVTSAGETWDGHEIRIEELVNDAENLSAEQLQERLDSLSEWCLTYLQERLQFCKQRREILKAIHEECEVNVTKLEKCHVAERDSIEKKLRAAGKPENTALWKRGSTNLAQREFEQELDSMDSVVQAKREWRAAVTCRDNLFSNNPVIDESVLREDLRKFVASRVA